MTMKTNAIETLGIEVSAELLREMLTEDFPDADDHDFESWSNAELEEATEWAATRMLVKVRGKGDPNPAPAPNFVLERLTGQSPPAKGKGLRGKDGPAILDEAADFGGEESFSVDDLPEEPGTVPIDELPAGSVIVRDGDDLKVIVPPSAAAEMQGKTPIAESPSPQSSPAIGFVDIESNRYGTPKILRDFLCSLWPEGIDRDPFHDPRSEIVANEGFSIRHGQDAMRLDTFEKVNSGMARCFTVYGNGPYVLTDKDTKQKNAGMGPKDWIPKLVRDWMRVSQRETHGARCSLVLCIPVYPGTEYWREWIWPHASIQWHGCMSFDIGGRQSKTANRYETCLAFFGPPTGHDRFVGLSRARGWAVTKKLGI